MCQLDHGRTNRLARKRMQWLYALFLLPGLAQDLRLLRALDASWPLATHHRPAGTEQHW
jgi:hypothetical protein